VRKAEQKRREEADRFPDEAPGNKVFPWENTLSRRVGGGGDPVRDLQGNVVTNLKEFLDPAEKSARERSSFLKQVSSMGRKSRPPNIQTPQANIDYMIDNGHRNLSRNPSFGSPVSPSYTRGGYTPDPYYQPSPSESTSSRMSSRSRVTRLDSGGEDNNIAVITFSRGGQAATFKVEGMSLGSFEQMLQMWDAHQINSSNLHR